MAKEENKEEGGVKTKEFLEEKEREEREEINEEKNKKLGKFKIVALFLLGIFAGVMFKSQALKSFTIGFDDYRIPAYQSDYPQSFQEPASSGEDRVEQNKTLQNDAQEELSNSQNGENRN
ncbi:MAG: hypothetical protein U5L10_02595 [Candidatus Moranbacteria bacterium]|nr:hypothetical protein [Candidatus Moranbacteria bacterium]